MEANSALVGADGAVHLHAVAAVDVDLATVVHPRDAEHDDALRLDHAFHDLEVQKVGVSRDVGGYAFDHLAYCLVEFFFSRVARDDVRHEPVNVVLGEFVHFIYTTKIKHRLQK